MMPFPSSTPKLRAGLQRHAMSHISQEPGLTRRDGAGQSSNVANGSLNGHARGRSSSNRVPALSHRMKHDKSILALAVSSKDIFAGTQGGEILVCARRNVP